MFSAPASGYSMRICLQRIDRTGPWFWDHTHIPSNRRNLKIGTLVLADKIACVTNRTQDQDSFRCLGIRPGDQSTTSRVIVGGKSVAMTTETLVTEPNRKSLLSFPRPHQTKSINMSTENLANIEKVCRVGRRSWGGGDFP